MDDSTDLTIEYIRALEIWVCVWYEEALDAKFVSAFYRPDVEIVDRLRGYFRAGLSPEDAVQACFGSRH
ncbi:hypothetical protein B0G80_7530 [Paraburkholderia sp. BL6669N2]|nr:hypothetical protein B0G80_7530 [Paraburkholderia sp. BL6669N2]